MKGSSGAGNNNDRKTDIYIYTHTLRTYKYILDTRPNSLMF